MKRVVLMVCVLVLVAMIGLRVQVKSNPILALQASAQAPNPACTPPMQVSSSIEQTAWQLFVAATCPVNNSQYPYVTWENWIEQNQVYGAPGAVQALGANQRPRFHGSPLGRFLEKKRKGKKGMTLEMLPEVANQNCTPPDKTWSHRTICEEVRMNSDTQGYVTAQKLTTRQGQINFVTAGKTFQFPMPAVEIKADWIQLASCSNPPPGVHVENVDNTCYALGGIHLISKLIDKWIWATFEPQNSTTNAQRCVVLGCNDPWGSSPATSSGASTQLTQALAALMTQANLAPEWRNYRLDGVQTDFLTPAGKATRLGNSIIEGDNAGTPKEMKVASCITCHALSTINAQGQSMNPNFIIGAPVVQPVSRDFVWSLGQAQ